MLNAVGIGCPVYVVLAAFGLRKLSPGVRYQWMMK